MIKPVGHTVLIKPDGVEETTKSGIVVMAPQSKKLEEAGQMTGTLVDYGDQSWKAFDKDFSGKPWAERGDRVLFARYAGKFVEDPEDPDTKYMIMLDEDIRAVIINGEENE